MRFPQSAALAAVLLVGAAATAGAQNPAPDTVAAPGPVLTLEEAQALARRNNPLHQQTVNNRSTAVAGRRAAYASLLPSADAQFATQYRQGGQTVFQGQSFGATSDVRNSSYDIGVNYTLNMSKLIAPRVAQANVEAADADIAGSQELLRASVTQQYLTVLASEARAALADTLLANTRVQVELARARAAAGAATQLDVSRAEVAHGQQQVASIQAHNTVEIDKLRLFERMGVPQPADVQLSSRFTVAPPTFTLDSVITLAHRRNPVVEAFRERSKVATLRLRQAQSLYMPSLSVSTGWGGYTSSYTDMNSILAGQQADFAGARQNCLDTQVIRANAGLTSDPSACDRFNWTPQLESAFRAENDRYPFDFTKNPWSISAAVSIPIFNGYQREQTIQEAAASRADARYEVRAQELRLRADVTSAYLTLTTAQRTVALQEQNAAAARQQLTLTEERYRVGAATFVDLADARATFERAESERITAIYDFHRAFAALESAVGRPLR